MVWFLLGVLVVFILAAIAEKQGKATETGAYDTPLIDFEK